MKVFTVLFLMAISNTLIHSQDYWERFDLPPYHGAVSNLKPISDGSLIYVNFSRGEPYCNSNKTSFNKLDMEGNSTVLCDAFTPNYISSAKYLSDKYGAFYCITKSSGKTEKIYSNVNDSGLEMDTISEFKSDNFIEFDGRIYRFETPTLYILDSDRNWQVFIDSLPILNRIINFGFNGNDVFYSDENQSIHYDLSTKNHHIEKMKYSDQFYKVVDGFDSNLVFVYYDNKGLSLNYYDKNENNWIVDSSSYYEKQYALFSQIVFYKNEFYVYTKKRFANLNIYEDAFQIGKLSLGKKFEEILTFAGCMNNMAVGNDKIYIGSSDFMNIYNLQGNLVRTVLSGDCGLESNLRFSVFDVDNIYYSNVAGLYSYNLITKKYQGLMSACTSATIRRFMRVNNTIYITPGYLFSTDNGNSWKVNDWSFSLEFPDEYGNLYSWYRSYQNLLILKSTNLGKTWDSIDYKVNGNGVELRSVNDIIYNQGFGMLAQSTDGVFRSTDYGVTWDKIAELPVNVNDTIVSGELYYSDNILHSVVNIKNSQVYRTVYYQSRDFGKNWVQIMYGLENVRKPVFSGADKYGNMYASDSSKIYILKKDRGYWTPLAHNFEAGTIDDFKVYEDGTLFVYSAPNSIYRSTMPLGAGETVEPGPTGLALFPNPATDLLTITFNNESTADVTVSVYNLLGNKVAEVCHEYMDPGNRCVSWNCSALPPGQYYARLQAGQNVKTAAFTVNK